MSDYLSVVQSQFHEWMDYLGMPTTTPTTPIYAIAGLAGVAVAAHLFLNSIPGETDLQMISNIDYTKVSLPTSDGRLSTLCLDGEENSWMMRMLRARVVCVWLCKCNCCGQRKRRLFARGGVFAQLTSTREKNSEKLDAVAELRSVHVRLSVIFP